ncbi:hypothetical protein GCM10007160_15210 [Litchfieldella qijiaojingensis]|uniref:Transcriptional regulator AbiEi antitoxin N-terminal domain-containing protein n=1 Tax=Litchfieldella qijiaojingensis TaxID=980347 RepID=A0ABQ2YPX7_9GAMM|nr:type IV toxin-antitoxin system AbiEi family antitoxin [Halomonas qijiaojingensis]GGX88692.1 hypothetical protein GCM10007160_15210 [Halomonas qijiaojingensis]
MLNTDARQQLRELLPLEMVATKQWLLDQGLNLHFVDNAVRSGTLQPLAAGVYALLEAKVSWQGVIASLQRMSEQPVHVGGLTAINLAGLGQYLSRGSEPRIQLYSADPLPRWLTRVPVKAKFVWHGTRRLWPETVMNDTRLLREDTWREGLPPVYFSCPEKATLEALMEVPKAMSFEHADELMQGLHNLSPRKLDTLLTACNNVKVKRLFLWLAERQGHAWFKRLKPEDYDIGSGKRVVAEGGRLNKKWHITVPKEM